MSEKSWIIGQTPNGAIHLGRLHNTNGWLPRVGETVKHTESTANAALLAFGISLAGQHTITVICVLTPEQNRLVSLLDDIDLLIDPHHDKLLGILLTIIKSGLSGTEFAGSKTT